MSRVALSRIKSLTFYKDAQTLSRRGKPVPQLNCIGKPCNLYTPEVIRCVNIGGEGTDVDWKCETDLPDSLRFGRVEVSCEGWDGPGDPYVLKGSCALDYRLVQVPGALRSDNQPSTPSRISRWFGTVSEDPAAAVFTIFWIACLLLILYSLVTSCLNGRSGSTDGSAPRLPRPGTDWHPGDNSWRGSDNNAGAPPPYSKHPPSSNDAQGDGWRPGFWTGAALGGLGSYLYNTRERERNRDARAGLYDWERERVVRPLRQPDSVFSSGLYVVG
ncbi:Store-operated calcium entry-associated regulatory factor [Grifola frondosa]|uniref:Store-operated calcium entry-associated regulatory factor n=1 Tax=Grifola frondosa TaxID=5627 RepID=A0A1C7M5M6_GRIFR|nr:Store-operated calcium entry-associated regulatory factor [Grifola frondosa]